MRAVCYMVTRGWYDKAVPSIKSMLINGNVDSIYVLTEDDVFPYDLPVIPINVSGQQFFRRDGPNYDGTRFSWMVLMRAALYQLFPDLDRILSIDADTIVLGDMSGLWDLPMDDYYFAGAREPWKSTGGKWYVQDLYVNAGVSFHNLRKLRDGKGDEVVAALNNRKYTYLEQDALNIYCEGSILEIPSAYNANSWTEPCNKDETIVVHYAAIANWWETDLVKDYKGRTVNETR